MTTLRNSIIIALALWPVLSVIVALAVGALLADSRFQKHSPVDPSNPVSDSSDTRKREAR
jgi:hypothetical protein